MNDIAILALAASLSLAAMGQTPDARLPSTATAGKHVKAVVQGSARPAEQAAKPAVQDPVQAKRTPTGFIIPPGEHAVEKLIDDAQRFLGINIFVNPTELAQAPQAPIVVTKQLELDYNGCLDVLTGMLYSRGFAMMAMNAEQGLYEVVLMAGPRRGEVARRAQTIPVEKVEEYRMRYMQILTVMPLEHINATVANNALRPFFAQGSQGGAGALNIGNLGDQQHLILQGFGPDVARATRLIKTADVATERNPQVEEQISNLWQRLTALEKRFKDR